MNRRLPPFSALRGFEAAARRQNFKAAAEELNVTESAISHQVKALEDFLDVRLFERGPNGVRLTVAGRQYQNDVTPLLDELAQATAQASGRAPEGALRLRATPAFAARWLAPRLRRFAERHPDIQIEIEEGILMPNFDSDGVDAAIAYGFEPVAGIELTPILSTTRFPVCAPEILTEAGPITRPEELLKLPLLQDMVGDDWVSWFRAAGVRAPDRAMKAAKGPRLAHCELTLRAAEAAQGVTLAYEVLAQDPLREGRLVRLFEAETEPKILYSLAYPVRRANQPMLSALREWLLSEAQLQAWQIAAAEPASN